MDGTIILSYLKKLQENNNRDWYHAHKAELAEANEVFEQFLSKLIIELGKEDAGILRFQPKDLTFRMNRDTRFSKDKSPYRPAFSAHLSPCGKAFIPLGDYIMLTPGGSFAGAGLYADAMKEATSRIRGRIVSHQDEWEDILHAPEFLADFKVMGTKLKNIPKGYEECAVDSAIGEYLKHKSWYLEYPVSDDAITDLDRIADTLLDKYRVMKPFNDFLNHALDGFVLPERPGK